MRLRGIFSVALLALLAACGPPQPMYQTDIQMIPPASELGRSCANNCALAQQNCQQNCAMQQQNCEHLSALEEQNSRLQADRDYENYVRDRTAQGKQIKKSRSDFVRYYGNSCDTSACNEQCKGNFNVCYGNCGGQMIPHTRCVANCHLIPQGMQSQGM